MVWFFQGREKGGEKKSNNDVAVGRRKACHIQSQFRRRLIGSRRCDVQNVKKKRHWTKKKNPWPIFIDNVANDLNDNEERICTIHIVYPSNWRDDLCLWHLNQFLFLTSRRNKKVILSYVPTICYCAYSFRRVFSLTCGKSIYKLNIHFFFFFSFIEKKNSNKLVLSCSFFLFQRAAVLAIKKTSISLLSRAVCAL